MEDKELFSDDDKNDITEQSSVENETEKKGNKLSIFSLSVINIHPLLFCISLADGLSASVTVSFIIDKSCHIHFNFNDSICNALDVSIKHGAKLEETIQPYASLILTAMDLLSTIFPVLMSFFLGAWSDQNGRKLLLVLPAAGYSFKYFLLAVFSLIPRLHPAIFILCEVPVTFSGGLVNLFTAAFAYICDISKGKNCSTRLAIIEAVRLSGKIIGSLSSAPLYIAAGSHRFVTVFGLSSFILFSGAMFTYFFVDESVTSIEHGKGIRHVFDISLLKDMLRVCFKKRENHKRAVIFLVIISLTSSVCTYFGENNVRFLFVRLKFDWNIQQYTEWISMTDGTVFFGSIVGTLLLKKYVKIPDVFLGIISFAMLAASNLYIALVPPNLPIMMYFAGLVKIFAGFFGPAGRSLISKSVSKEDLGKVFALTTSSQCIFPLAVTPLYTLLYNYTLEFLPETIFFLSAALNITNIAFFILIYILRKRATMEPDREIILPKDSIE